MMTFYLFRMYVEKVIHKSLPKEENCGEFSFTKNGTTAAVRDRTPGALLARARGLAGSRDATA